MLPEPLPIQVKPRAAPVLSPIIQRLLVWDVPETGRWVTGSVLPLSIFSVAVGEGKAIAAGMVISGAIRITWSRQIALQITVIESVHALVAKNPDVRHTNTVQVGQFREQPPTFDHINHVAHRVWRHTPQVPNQRRIHGNAADSITV